MRSRELVVFVGVTLVALLFALFSRFSRDGEAVPVAAPEASAAAAGGAVPGPATTPEPAGSAGATDDVAGSAEAAPRAALAARGAPRVEVRAEAALFRLHGRVVDAASGAPLAGARLALGPALDPGGDAPESRAEHTAVTGTDGRYVLDGVGPGIRELECRLAGHGTLVRRYVAFAPDGPRAKEQDLELEPGARIAGRVVAPDGSGVAGVRLEATGFLPGRIGRGSAVTDAGGAFAIDDLIAGGYLVTLASSAWSAEPVAGVETGTGELVIRAVPNGAVSGRVRRADGGDPPSAFRIRLRDAHPTDVVLGAERSVHELTDRTDGSFGIDGVLPGRYVLEAEAPRLASSFSDAFEVRAGDVAGGVEITLGTGATLTGLVVDAYTKEPVAGAVVETRENHWNPRNAALFATMFRSAVTKAETRTGADGRFELRLLTPGEVQVRVRLADRFELVQDDVRLHAGVTTDLGRLGLEYGARVAGTVFAPDGTPMSDAPVSLRNPDGTAIVAGTRSDADGRFELRGCAPGRYALWVDPAPDGHPERPPARVELTLVDRREVVADLRVTGELRAR